MIRLQKIGLIVLGVLTCSQLFGQLPKYIVKSDTQDFKPLSFKEVKISGTRHHEVGLDKVANQSTEDHLEQINGLSLVRRGNYAAEPVFRGLNANQTAVTIDGMKIFGACTDRMDPATSYVAPDNLGEACMDQSGDCNSSCNMASLDLRTRKLKRPSKPVSGAFNSGFNSNAMGRVFSGEVTLFKNNNALRIQSFYTKSENYRAGGGDEILYSQFEKWNGVIHYKRFINDNNVFEIKYIADRAFDIGYPALPMDVSFAGGDILSVDFKSYLNRKFSKTLKVKLYGNHIEHIMDDSKRPDVPIRMDMPGLSRTYGAFIIDEIGFGKHRVSLKPEYYFNRSYAEMTMYPTGEAAMFMLTWPDVHRHSGLFSIYHHYKKNCQFDLTNSAQIEVQSASVMSDFGKKQLQAIGYDYEASIRRKGLQLKSEFGYYLTSQNRTAFKVSFTERIPQVSEAFGYYLFNSLDRYDYMGNPKLNNEKSLQFELSHSVNLKKLKLSLNLFHYAFRDYIMGVNSELDAMTIGANGVREYQNIQAASIRGIELSGTVMVSERFQIHSQTSLTKGTDHEDENLPLIPSVKCINQLKYNGKVIDLNGQYTYSAAQNNIAAYYGERVTPAYHLVDFTISRDFAWQKRQLNASLSLRNAFDVNYVDHLDWNKIPRPGRSFDINLKYLF